MKRMKRWQAYGVAGCWVTIWALVGSLAAAKADEPVAVAPPVADTWYVQTRVSTDFGIVTTHYWSKGVMFRAATILAGHPVTTIVNGPRYSVYDALLGTGATIERNADAVAKDAQRGRPFGRELDDLLEAGGEKVSDGSLPEGEGGYEVYQLTNANGRRRVMVTLSDPPLPFRVETFVRENGATGILEYAGWQRGLEIQDSLFQLPDTIVFEQVSYDDYTRRVRNEPIGPAPIYYRDLLHGSRSKAH
ncbi:MAG: hypothetical protein GY733_22270 [bacterium]|nr:hypothetical protein [bacterium]